jgi:hypothetical protein
MRRLATKRLRKHHLSLTDVHDLTQCDACRNRDFLDRADIKVSRLWGDGIVV